MFGVILKLVKYASKTYASDDLISQRPRLRSFVSMCYLLYWWKDNCIHFEMFEIWFGALSSKPVDVF